MSDAASAAGAAGSASQGSPNASASQSADGTKPGARPGDADRSRGGDRPRSEAAAAAEPKAKPAQETRGQPKPEARPEKKPEPKVERRAAGDAGDKDDASPDPKAAKHRVKVDGKEIEVSYEDLVQGYGHNKTANERLREAAELRKTTQAELESAKTYKTVLEAVESGDWRPLVDRVGLEKAEEFAVEFLEQKMEWEGLSEEQRELHRLRRRTKAFESKEEEAAKAAAAERRQQLEADAVTKIDVEIGEVLKAAGKKATPRVVARIAEQILADLETKEKRAGQSPLTAKQAYDKTVREIHQDVAEYLANTSATELKKILPKPLLDALRQANVEEALAQDPFRSGARPTTSAERSSRRTPQKLGTDDWFARKEKQFANKKR